MSGSGGFAVFRSDNGERFYNPPAIHRRRDHLLQKQQSHIQNHRHQLQEMAVADTDNRTDSDDSNVTSSIPPLTSSSSSSYHSRPPNVSNLDSFLDSVTPIVPAEKSCELIPCGLLHLQTSLRGQRSEEDDVHPYYCLGDLWETFREWSVYGAGVPLLLYGRHPTIQYYVPFLSGIQLYIDPQNPHTRHRRPGEESDAESSRESSSYGCSDSVLNGHNLMHQKMNRLSMSDNFLPNSWSDEAEASDSPGTLVFEYMEQEQPHSRRPLADKVTVLASQFPELIKYRSCDLSPSSWICVAWYPIYRIPIGPTLKDLDASFITFHSLSTQPASYGQAQFSNLNGEAGLGSRVHLPVFGLASYKLKGSIISPCGPQECEQENGLLEAASHWLDRLQALVPDYQFFVNRYSQWR